MADWSGTARSNKFRVKDRDLFIGWVARFNPPGPNRKDYESDEEFEDEDSDEGEGEDSDDEEDDGDYEDVDDEDFDDEDADYDDEEYA